MTDFSKTSPCQPLLDYFGKLIPLKQEEKELVAAKFHPYTFVKKQFALQEGKVCDYFDFVVKGCLRLFKVDEKGDYHVFQFATENYWILDLTSFHKRIPSTLNIEALEDTLVLRITHRDLLDLYIQAPKFDRIFRVLLENHFMQQQERI
ncbi:Crp/Fnr family transcriptional regulator [Aquiflexum sp. LQ15W]|uniref:Crp/Fnr family transcriptional regulator n=1 Tax=Cognataquiflexum nitidum TaxID=2922272 RepID=UPI001F130FE4|nr:Crp/Fnr family transcriptional regulator [Cognataquiflexum nitidum]MCH6198808.1 Crp/Fnr family transcriptional regulator [Cognataquiflexum nitidum]